MRTSMLIVEFLVGGILISLALVFLFSSLFFGDIFAVLRSLFQNQPFLLNTSGISINVPQDLFQWAGALLLLSTIFVAIAYAVGVFSGFFAREAFEWMLIRTRRNRLERYLKSLEDDGLNPRQIPFLKGLKVGTDQIPTGIMRFDVLMKSPELYQDITSQLHRYRLMRISYIAEVLLIAAIVVHLFREFSSPLMRVLALIVLFGVLIFPMVYYLYRRYSISIKESNRKSIKEFFVRLLFLAFCALIVLTAAILLREFSLMGFLVVLIAATFLNTAVIYDRFERYCRAVERSYKVLMIAEKKKTNVILSKMTAENLSVSFRSS